MDMTTLPTEPSHKQFANRFMRTKVCPSTGTTSRHGKVTLSGPVKTLEDKTHAKAAAVAGEDNVTDNLEVAPASK
jgi:hypothetical protein